MSNEMKLCKNCKYYNVVESIKVVINILCSCPKIIDPVHGGIVNKPCRHMRENECGIDAKFYEEE